MSSTTYELVQLRVDYTSKSNVRVMPKWRSPTPHVYEREAIVRLPRKNNLPIPDLTRLASVGGRLALPTAVVAEMGCVFLGKCCRAYNFYQHIQARWPPPPSSGVHYSLVPLHSFTEFIKTTEPFASLVIPIHDRVHMEQPGGARAVKLRLKIEALRNKLKYTVNDRVETAARLHQLAELEAELRQRIEAVEARLTASVTGRGGDS